MTRFSLSSTPAHIISLPKMTARRQHMAALMETHNISYHFHDGVVGTKKIPSVIQAFRTTLDAIETLPAMVLEDDLRALRDPRDLPPLPQDADVVYLFAHQDGVGQLERRYLRHFGWRALSGLALTRAYDDDYLRLYSQIGGLAILFVTEAGRDAFRQAISPEKVGRMPCDVAFANALREVKAYCLQSPVFAEDIALQPPAKQNDARAALTSTPPTPNHLGEIRLLAHPKKLGDDLAEFQVVEAAPDQWVWQLIQTRPTR